MRLLDDPPPDERAGEGDDREGVLETVPPDGLLLDEGRAREVGLELLDGRARELGLELLDGRARELGLELLDGRARELGLELLDGRARELGLELLDGRARELGLELLDGRARELGLELLDGRARELGLELLDGRVLLPVGRRVVERTRPALLPVVRRSVPTRLVLRPEFVLLVELTLPALLPVVCRVVLTRPALRPVEVLLTIRLPRVVDVPRELPEFRTPPRVNPRAFSSSSPGLLRTAVRRPPLASDVFRTPNRFRSGVDEPSVGLLTDDPRL